jgi:hypothetical protein
MRNTRITEASNELADLLGIIGMSILIVIAVFAAYEFLKAFLLLHNIADQKHIFQPVFRVNAAHGKIKYNK